MPKSERDKYPNRILLCRNHHHGVVDADPEKWTVDELLKMKERHQKEIAARSAPMTEVQGDIKARGISGHSVIGADIRKPTRIRPGTSITAEGTDVEKVTGLQIGGDDSD